MGKDITFEMELSKIGPHCNTQLKKQVSSINMAIYANNGMGKSFISRSFKRITDFKALDTSKVEAVEQMKKDSSAMIRFGENEGKMSLTVSKGESVCHTDITFRSGEMPVIHDTSGFLYHVFNSEYVRENLEAVKYRPEDKVSGFILGKVNIDLSLEKEKLSSLEEQITCIDKDLKQSVTDQISTLKSLGVQANTSELKQITFDNLVAKRVTIETRSFSDVKSKYTQLVGMPDDIPDVSKIPLIDTIELTECINAANEILETSYSLSSFEEQFKREMAEKSSFISAGLVLSDGKKCPFCGQDFNESAVSLINLYTKYLQDEEAKTLSKIDDLLKKIEKSYSALSNVADSFIRTKPTYDKVRAFFPSLENEAMDEIEVLSLSNYLKGIADLLKDKKKDISYIISISDKSDVAEMFSPLIAAVSCNNRRIDIVNNTKNNISRERLSLRKALCNSAQNELVAMKTDQIDKRSDLLKQVQLLNDEISEKENQAKIDKRQLLVEELQRYLTAFFGDKYEFDGNNFCIRFQKNDLIENADDVLSDGEKSILAFCFYLANIHAIVEKESDYNRILMIIDDPVSSMDFSYVYSVAQAIRNLGRIKHMDRVRFIILTHNMEFISILIRNKIVKQKYVLVDGKFEDFKDHFVTPYLSHLEDIYKVANKQIPPRHTIPNSIRHILETVYRFEGSVGDFESYILNQKELNNSSFLYSLIEDCSHGTIREENGYTDDMLISACSDMIAFLASKYPGQIEGIKQLVAS